MVRSWDARVRGAAEKVVPQADAFSTDGGGDQLSTDGGGSESDKPPLLSEPASEQGDHSADQVVDTAEVERSSRAEVESSSEHSEAAWPAEVDQVRTPLETSLTEGFRAEASEVVVEGLCGAVAAVGLAVSIADRQSGELIWHSPSWSSRFGEKNELGRYWPSSTDLGESPLPSQGESWQRCRTMLLADGTEDLVELLLLGSTTDEEGQGFVTVVALEGAPNGPQITDRGEVSGIIEGAIQVAADSHSGEVKHRVAVLYVDLDRFKVVHDLVGNLEALRLLELVSRRVRSTMRTTDLFFRLPSDEFVVIATDLDRPGAAEELAERVRLAVATLADLGHDMALTASVGVALVEPDQSGDELLSAAETAVYLAKGRGRNRVAVHDEELRARSQRLLIVERQLRKAIDRRDVRFAYQPVVHMATGAVVGAEALLRLGGEVGLSAMEVIAAAEHSGLMGALGSLVVEGVNEQLSSLLRGSDRDFEVMVNLSGTQLEDDALLATLSRMAEDSEIPAGRLSVEIPESVVAENKRAFLRLTELVRPSFRIGIDGFGATMSSLTLLESLPIDYVKLHRTVTGTAGLVGDGPDRVAKIISIADGIGVTTIALGVESLEQVDVLQSLGCCMAQGFLYAGAVAVEDLLELVEVGFDGSVKTP